MIAAFACRRESIERRSRSFDSSAPVRLSREDLLERSGVGQDLITALRKAGVITTGPGGFFDEHAVDGLVELPYVTECFRAVRL